MENNNLMYAHKQLDNYSIINRLKDIKEKKQLIFLCLGNSKIWYDSFGPIIGSLFKLLDFKVFIYGNTKANITAKNIDEYINMIYGFHKDPYIIVFDNAISSDSIPLLKIKEGPVTCAVMSEQRKTIGDLSITYCLNRYNMAKNSNYSKMLTEIRNIVRLFLFCFQ